MTCSIPYNDTFKKEKKILSKKEKKICGTKLFRGK